MEDIADLDIAGVATAISSKSLSPIDLTERMLERISLVDPYLKSYVELLPEQARRAAREADAEIRSGKYRGPLHGVPISIKALYDLKGVTSASGSKVREDYVPAADSTVIQKLREAGAVILGTTTTYEFAFGFDARPTRNAWNIPSGSSGGAAAAVAAGLCFAGIGSDSGGSIRTPAVPDYTRAIAGDIRGMRVGLPTTYFFDDIQPAVGDAVTDAVRRLERLGAIIVPIAVPGIDGIIDSWLIIAIAEAVTYHQQSLRAKADLYGEDVRRLLEAGELMLATTYINAQRVRMAWKWSL
jgi:aspartyl-tRNA(Asn)/glutamyl-tRNA(Gln) amidotransferase subunit A